MKSYLWYILMFITIFSFFSNENALAQVSTDFLSKIEKNIAPNSPSSKIIKLQNLFKELNLYSGSIDWDFNSIKDVLINYQVTNWIIESSTSEDAGYFWKKTINSLSSNYYNFEEKALLTLKLDEVLPPSIWPRTFTVTAYYSPLPNQSKYLKWNYEDEIKLNWKWIHWASWKPVFSWMLAWPQNYKFWTKIYIEWLWIWSVEDRWSAIVSSWNRWYENDRIDVWMWYWDEWLENAIKWWKKVVKWEILEDNALITMKFNENKKLAMSDETKKQLESIKQKILSYAEKKYSWNSKLKEIYKANIKNTLNKYIAEIQNNEKKEQLIYLRAIL